MWAVHHDLIDSIFFIQSKEGCDQITSELVDLGEKATVFGVFWTNPNKIDSTTQMKTCFTKAL